MNEFLIETVECRRFDSSEFATPIELEFHRNPRWSDLLRTGRTLLVSDEAVAGHALIRLTARIALTGAMLPPLSILRGREEPVLLDDNDVFSLSLAIAKFGPVPATEDYTAGSRYLELRSVVERSLGVQHIHLGIRENERWSRVEGRIESLSRQLGEYSIALSESPELSFQKFVELISRNKRIFGLASSTNTLLSATALGSAYQVVLGQPVLAVELAAAGASAYIVLKFGAAVGKKIEQIVGRW